MTGTDQIGTETRTAIEIGRGTVGDRDLRKIGNDGARGIGMTTSGPPQLRPRVHQIPEKTQHLIKNANLFLSRSV